MTINPIAVILKQAGLSSEEIEAIEKVIVAQSKDEEWLTPDRLSQRFEISTSNIKSGVYFARIQGLNGSKTVKLIKQ